MKLLLKIYSVTIAFILLNATYSNCQNASGSSFFREVILKVDTASYSYSRNSILYKGDRNIYFNYDNNQAVCEINLFALNFDHIEKIRLHPSGDYEIIDSLVIINEEYARGKVRFNNFNKSNFLSFMVTIVEFKTQKPIIHQIKLLPVTKTIVDFNPEDLELILGRRKYLS
ncbi:MAG: hypothetical protein M3421_14260 [Bacteroidota bacterium]|nr:hypothetical protein [Bacteroidota bacterium]